MTFLKKCQNPDCNKEQKYTLEKNCSLCKLETKDPHYKFVKIKDAPKITNSKDVRKKPRNKISSS